MTELALIGTRLLQAGLVVAMIVGVSRRNVPVTVNATLALTVAVLADFISFLTGSLPYGPQIVLPEMATLWISLAAFVHVLGMYGLYVSTGWWDDIAHLLSGALVGALLYGVGLAVESRLPGFVLPGGSLALMVVSLTLAIGVAWELIEVFARLVSDRVGVRPVLEQYGRYDTFFDLVFDVIGAFVVLVFDVRIFEPAADLIIFEWGYTTVSIVFGLPS